MSEDKRQNEIIRVHRQPNNFVTMNKGFLENNSLSWKAKGILAYLLSKPDNWKVIANDLINRATDGKAAVYNGLNELKEHGHYQKRPVRDETGKRISYWEGTVSEVPMDFPENTLSSLLPDYQDIDNQDIDNQDIGYQDIENREHSNNDFNKKEVINTECTNNHVSQVLSATPNGQDKTDRASAHALLNDEQKLEALKSLIKDNIYYADFANHKKADLRLVDEFISVIIDCLMSEGKYVRIGGEDKPRVLVNHNLMRLRYDDIEHAIERFQSVTERITKKKQYILTLLYNCKMESEVTS